MERESPSAAAPIGWWWRTGEIAVEEDEQMRGDVAVVGWGAPTDGAAHLIRGTLARRLAALALRLSVWLVPALLFGVVMAVTVYALTGFGIPLGVALVPFTLVIVHFTVTRFAYAVAARRRRAPTGVDLTREKHPDLWGDDRRRVRGFWCPAAGTGPHRRGPGRGRGCGQGSACSGQHRDVSWCWASLRCAP